MSSIFDNKSRDHDYLEKILKFGSNSKNSEIGLGDRLKSEQQNKIITRSPSMLQQPHFLYRLKLIFVYLIVKLKSCHSLLPKKFRDKLPISWNDHMFWVALKSGGQKVYSEYYCEMEKPLSYKPKISVTGEYQLTEKDIQGFFENSFIGPFDVLSSDEVEQVRKHLVNLTNTESPIYSYSKGDYKLDIRKNEQEKIELNSLNETEKYFVNIMNSWDRHLDDPILLNLFESPAITERCKQILGSDILLWKTHFFETPPLSNGSSWHQNSNWLTLNTRELILKPQNDKEIFEITCWIALTDAPKERSCLTIIPGSQKKIYPLRTRTANNKIYKPDRIYSHGEKIDYDIDPEKVKYIEAKAGQCIIFCERAIHGSTNNTTGSTRLSAVGRYVTANTEIFPEQMEKGVLNMDSVGVNNVKLNNWKPISIEKETNQVK